jgi:putative ABC transport system permease protein
MIVQIALTLALLSGAGLMARSFLRLYRPAIGVDTTRLVTMRLVFPARRYPAFDDIISLMASLDERLNSLPSVEAASTVTGLPYVGADTSSIEIEGQPSTASDNERQIVFLSTGQRYLETVGARILRGRGFIDSDGSPGREVALINERMATLFFGGRDPIGQRIRLPAVQRPGRPAAWATIVGVTPTIRQRSLQDAPEADPVVYIPNAQHVSHRSGTELLVRARSGDVAALTAQLQQAVFSIDSELPIASISRMDQILAQQRWPIRVFGTMFVAFALTALVLAAVGLHAVIGHSVSQRTAEIGVRLALGAGSPQIAALVASRAMSYVAAGLVVGLIGAVILGNTMSAVLVGTSATDAATLVLVVMIVVATAVLACVIPVWRAVRLAPVIALRYE